MAILPKFTKILNMLRYCQARVLRFWGHFISRFFAKAKLVVMLEGIERKYVGSSNVTEEKGYGKPASSAKGTRTLPPGITKSIS
jgi:hypothetical protein